MDPYTDEENLLVLDDNEEFAEEFDEEFENEESLKDDQSEEEKVVEEEKEEEKETKNEEPLTKTAKKEPILPSEEPEPEELEEPEVTMGSDFKLPMEIINMEKVLSFTLSIQRQVEEFKKTNERKQRLFAQKLKTLNEEKELVDLENTKLRKENESLKQQLKRVSQHLLNVSSNYRFMGLEKSKNEDDSKLLSFVKEDEPKNQSFLRHSRNSTYSNQNNTISFTEVSNFLATGNRRRSRPKAHYRHRKNTSNLSRERNTERSPPIRSSRKKSKGNFRNRRSRSAVRTRKTPKKKYGKYNSVFDKLTDKSLYTGVYAKRFTSKDGRINQFASNGAVKSIHTILRPNLGRLSLNYGEF